MYRQMVQTAAEHGWGDYRAAPTFQDDVMGAYSITIIFYAALMSNLKIVLIQMEFSTWSWMHLA
ncbi:hypothetical protein [Campylobacter coli]|uniref:hypothetical protein n=1 Tax=Campylobacter coli TaxID=195 RepID=UPI003A80CD82